MFEQSNHKIWELSLRENTTGELYSTSAIYIPARPAPITVAQLPPQYPVNGDTFHVPNADCRWAMLDIQDPDYMSHYRLPHSIWENGVQQASISEVGKPTYDDLSDEEKAELNAEFEKYYSDNRNGSLLMCLVRGSAWCAIRLPVRWLRR